MKFIIFLIFAFSLIACTNEQTFKVESTSITSNDTKNQSIIIDSNLWLEDFRAFRDAVYKRDIEKVKTYFDFPIKKEGEGIWHFSDTDYYYNENRDTARKFTEKDFVKYFDKIFDKDFIKALLKIKTEELITKKETQTQGLSNGKDKHYTLSANHNNNSLSLHFNTNDLYRQKNYEPIKTEFSIILVFEIVGSSKIKYSHFNFAG